MSPARYGSPAAFKQALEHRLRAQSALTATALARLRQLFVFERMLARLSDRFGERMVLKGGLVVELRVRRARTTKDIDLRLEGDPGSALGELQEAGRLDLGDFLRYEVRADRRHPTIDAEGMIYQGRRFRVEAGLAGKIYGAAFGLDVAFAEPLAGKVDVGEGPPWLAFAGFPRTRVRLYPIETHIAEKVHAYTLPRSRPNSRVKDLPDIALLASVRSLEGSLLREALQATFRHRKTHGLPFSMPPPPPSWAGVYEAMARSDRLEWTSLADLAKAVADFLDPVLGGGAGRWNPAAWTWRRG